MTTFRRLTLFRHCVKSVQIRRFSGPYLSVFRMNTEIRTRKNSVSGYFSCSGKFKTTLIQLIRTKENSAFGVSDMCCTKMFTHLRLHLSHLIQTQYSYKFKHIVNDTKNLNDTAIVLLILKQLLITDCFAKFILFNEQIYFMAYVNYIPLCRTIQKINY